MKYRVVAFDLDGTLINSQREILESSLKAIEAIRQQGVKVVVVTGRHHVAARAYHHQLQLDTPAICCNGTYLYDFMSNKIVRGNSIAPESAATIIESMNDDSINMLMYTTEAMNFQKVDDNIAGLQKWSQTLEPHLRPILRQADLAHVLANGETVWKFVAAGDDTALIQKRVGELEQQLPLSCEWSWSNRVDLSAAGNTKGNQLRQLLDDWAISPSEVIAFGDNGNDLSLIELAGVGVAMGNAVEPLKAAADYVTTSNDESGIADALAHFFDLD